MKSPVYLEADRRRSRHNGSADDARPDLSVVVVENASLPGSRGFAMPLVELGWIAACGNTGPTVMLSGDV